MWIGFYQFPSSLIYFDCVFLGVCAIIRSKTGFVVYKMRHFLFSEF